MSRRWPLSHLPEPSYENGLRKVMSVELMGRAEMGVYFPDSALRLERLLGLVKSLIAVKA